LKFAFIAGCFTIALLSYFFTWSKRDWGWLTLALGFTLAADFFLILHNLHLPGVAVFCFAHVAYIFRAITTRQERATPHEGMPPCVKSPTCNNGASNGTIAHTATVASSSQHMQKSCPATALLSQLKTLPGILICIVALVAIMLAFIWLDAIFVVTGIYATLFITNIYVNARYLLRNRALAITGLLLFAACDINVLLFNLPTYMNAPRALTNVFPLIWMFYLPAQMLLSISAIDYSRWRQR